MVLGGILVCGALACAAVAYGDLAEETVEGLQPIDPVLAVSSRQRLPGALKLPARP